MKGRERNEVTSPVWLWLSLSSLMFLLRNSCEFLWYSACSSSSCGRGNRQGDLKQRFWKLDTFSFLACVAATHLDEVVGVVVFLGGKVVQVCRVLVLHRQMEEVKLTGPVTESSIQRSDFITLIISNLLQASSTSSLSPSCLAWGPVLAWLLLMDRQLKSMEKHLKRLYSTWKLTQ